MFFLTGIPFENELTSLYPRLTTLAAGQPSPDKQSFPPFLLDYYKSQKRKFKEKENNELGENLSYLVIYFEQIYVQVK